MKKYKYWGGIAIAILLIFMVLGPLYFSKSTFDANCAPQIVESKYIDGNDEVIIKGEVVDLHCILIHRDPGKGNTHAVCAQMCFNRGLPIGFLANGVLYLLLDREQSSPKNSVIEYVGKISELRGKLITHIGVNAIQIKSIKEV